MPNLEQYESAVAYFSSGERAESFEMYEGSGSVLLSAPHAVTQLRGGTPKCAERYAGALAYLLGAELGVHRILKTRDVGDDANYDPQSPYRDALCDMLRRTGAKYVLDLHQLRRDRPMSLCIGTGHGRNISRDPLAADIVRESFAAHGLEPITVDTPFAAAKPATVCATAASAGACALQLELNTRLLQPDSPEFDYERVYDALRDVIIRLNRR